VMKTVLLVCLFSQQKCLKYVHSFVGQPVYSECYKSVTVERNVDITVGIAIAEVFSRAPAVLPGQ
jgi:hypothetical protein